VIFGRKLQRKTVARGRCRTRIVTEGVTPSLYVYYKQPHLQQHHQEGRALRTATTIKNTDDVGVGRRLKNLPAPREIGFAANRRVLEVERLSHDGQIGEQALARLQRPAGVEDQHAAALPFGPERVQSLLAALVIFSLQPRGFQNRQLRPLLAQRLGVEESRITAGRMSDDLRRLRLHGIIERIAGTRRYRLTGAGLKTALFYSRVYQRGLRPGLSRLQDRRLRDHSLLAKSFHAFHRQLTDYGQLQLAA
jgi:hypothetical protein